MTSPKAIPSRRVVPLALLLVVTGCGGGGGSSSPLEQLAQFTRAEIDRQGVPGAAIAVVAKGELVYQQGFGFKDLARTSPVGKDTLFGVGSTTKMLVASAVLTLVEEGKLDLDAPITDYVPTFSVASGDPSAVHVRHLLSHTSGLPDFDAEGHSCSHDLGQWFEDEANRAPLLSTPGELWNYSGRGYMLAGLALERISGDSFEDAMRRRVFDPAGMEHATFDPQIAKQGDHSLGHAGPAGEVELDGYTCRATEPAGEALFVSAPEMARFARALMSGGGGVLTPGSVAALEASEMATHQIPGEGYGLGLSMRDAPEAPGTRVYYHGGDDGRFTASVAMVPERGFAVVVLFNDTDAVPEVVSQKALELVLGFREALPGPTRAAHPDQWATDPSTWAKYTGTYDEPYTYGRAVVTLEGGKLLVEMVDRSPGVKMEMSQIAADYFQVSATGMNVTFWFGEDPAAARYAVTRTAVFTRAE